MALTVNTLKAFMHSTLLENFPDTQTTVDGQTTNTPNNTLTNAVEIANQNYNTLTGSLPPKVVVRFDSLSYQVKIALVHVYNYVMQDKALLHNLSLTGLGISEDEVFEHFLALREAEQKEINDMRKELLDEIKDKDEDSQRYGAVIYQKYGRRLNGRRLP